MKIPRVVAVLFAAIPAVFLYGHAAHGQSFNATHCSYSGVSGTTLACEVDDSWAVISNGGYWSAWIGFDTEFETGTQFTSSSLHLPACSEGFGDLQVYLMTHTVGGTLGYNQTGWVPVSNPGSVNAWDGGCGYGRCETYRSADPIGEVTVNQTTMCESLLNPGGIQIQIDADAAEQLIALPDTYWLGIYGDGPDGTTNLYWAGTDKAMLESYISVGNAIPPGPTSTCDICSGSELLSPVVGWGEPDEELIVTSTFQTYVNSVMDTSTTTIPGCYIYAGSRTIDTFLALTSGGLGPQTISWNMGSGTGATFEFDLSDWEMFLPSWVWNDLRPIAWNIFAVFGWMALAWFIWNDWMGDTDRNVDSRKNED